MIVHPDTSPAVPERIKKTNGFGAVSGNYITKDGRLLPCGEPDPNSMREDETPY